jgi:hypothetical protein
MPVISDASARIRAMRRFLVLAREMLDEQTRDPLLDGYEAKRRARHPHLRSPDPDFEALDRWTEAVSEFPLLLWATALGYAFSIIETFLGVAAAQAAAVADREPGQPRGPKIEGWLAEIRGHGAPVRIQPATMEELRALRQVRNSLTHRLTIDETEVQPRVAGDLVRDPVGNLVPTPRLAARALDAAEVVIAAVAYALEAQVERAAQRSARHTPRLPGAE